MLINNDQKLKEVIGNQRIKKKPKMALVNNKIMKISIVLITIDNNKG